MRNLEKLKSPEKKEEEKVLFELPDDIERVRQLALKLDGYNERIIEAEGSGRFEKKISPVCAKEILKEVIRAGKFTAGSEIKAFNKAILELSDGGRNDLIDSDIAMIKDSLKNYVGVIRSYCEGAEWAVSGGTGLPGIEKIDKSKPEKLQGHQ